MKPEPYGTLQNNKQRTFFRDNESPTLLEEKAAITTGRNVLFCSVSLDTETW